MIKPEHEYQKHYFHYLDVKLISMEMPLIVPNASYYNWTSVFEIPTGGWLKIDQNYITLCPICMISSPIFLPRPVGSHMVHALDTGFSRYVRQLESTHLNTRTAHHLTKHEKAHYVTNVVNFALHSTIVRSLFLGFKQFGTAYITYPYIYPQNDIQLYIVFDRLYL